MCTTHIGENEDGVGLGAEAARVQRLVVENADALELTQELETLKTGGLLDIGGHGSGLSTGTVELRGRGTAGAGACGDGECASGLEGNAGSTDCRTSGGSQDRGEHFFPIENDEEDGLNDEDESLAVEITGV